MMYLILFLKLNALGNPHRQNLCCFLDDTVDHFLCAANRLGQGSIGNIVIKLMYQAGLFFVLVW